MSKLFCFGLGYSAEALSRRLAPEGWQVAGTSRTADKTDHIAGLGYDAANNCCAPMAGGDAGSVIIKVNMGGCPIK